MTEGQADVVLEIVLSRGYEACFAAGRVGGLSQLPEFGDLLTGVGHDAF